MVRAIREVVVQQQEAVLFAALREPHPGEAEGDRFQIRLERACPRIVGLGGVPFPVVAAQFGPPEEERRFARLPRDRAGSRLDGLIEVSVG